MKLRMRTDKSIDLSNKKLITLYKGDNFELVDIVQDCYKVKLPMKQKGKFRHALVKDSEGVLED